jgi:hypothetical protein
MDEVYYYNHVYKLDHAAIMPLHVQHYCHFLCATIYLYLEYKEWMRWSMVEGEILNQLIFL